VLGSYAEYAAVPADRLVKIPAGVNEREAAAAMLQGMTAHYLLHEFRRPKQGDSVLIHAAAGGMGLLLVQWARHLGARVFGTVSTEEKAKAAREAGASEVIFYVRRDFVAEIKRLTGGRGVDLIIDGVGKSTFPGDLEAVALRGHIVIFGAASGPADPIIPNALMARSITVSGGSLGNYLLTREELLRRAGEVIAGIRAGWLRLRIAKVLPLAEAAEAHRLLEGRHTIGKLLLSVRG
jgi:NADPH2:quinone reductase